MQTDDETARNWIRGFEDRTLRALDLLERRLNFKTAYFHAYRSRCIGADGKEEPSGYFFMAGWLLLEKMREAAANKESDPARVEERVISDLRKGELPENYKGKWSALLIADRFFDEKTLSRRREEAEKALRLRSEWTWENWCKKRSWTSCAALSEIGNLSKRLKELLKKVNDAFLAAFNQYSYDPKLKDPTFWFSEDHYQESHQLEMCIGRMAKWVAEWRRDPSLTRRDAQTLRNLLLEFQEIDAEFAQEMAAINESPPMYSMLERIAFKADLLR